MSVKYNYIHLHQCIMQKRQQQAAQNREELLSAALKIFRQQGIRAPLQLVIDEAGVGRATFYRNFQDRRELVIALMEQDLTALMEYWRVIDRHDPIMVDIYLRRDAILQPLIDQAIAHQVCRPDLTTHDYALITGILRASFQGMTDAEQIALATRAVDLLIDGIKA